MITAQYLPCVIRDERTDFIRSKYMDKKYVTPVNLDENLLFRRVELAVESDDLILLVRTWAQGVKLGQPLPSKVHNQIFQIIPLYNYYHFH